MVSLNLFREELSKKFDEDHPNCLHFEHPEMLIKMYQNEKLDHLWAIVVPYLMNQKVNILSLGFYSTNGGGHLALAIFDDELSVFDLKCKGSNGMVTENYPLCEMSQVEELVVRFVNCKIVKK